MRFKVRHLPNREGYALCGEKRPSRWVKPWWRICQRCTRCSQARMKKLAQETKHEG